jgi:mRNA interferase MazF
LEPTKGREQRGRRPAIVLSPRAYNERAGLCVACAITNQAKGFRFEVPIPAGAVMAGVVLADQVRCLSWMERRAELISSAPSDVVDEAREKLAARDRIGARFTGAAPPGRGTNGGEQLELRRGDQSL